nr:family 1 glycosylhydrolase [Microbacterium halimionae]
MHFGVGVENTFVPQSSSSERPIDEYVLTEHDLRWRDDLDLACAVGSDFMRWGIPWHIVNPQKGRWDWSWCDRVMERFGEIGLRPIVDLLHYGTPTWLENEFLHPDFPEFVSEYASRAAERYATVATDYTPVNEPMIHALFCGEYGYWPPYGRGESGLVALSLAVARGFVRTQHAIVEQLGTAATFVHVDASMRYRGDVDAPEHRDTARRLTHQAFLVEDLVTGAVGDGHALVDLLRSHGASDEDFAWFFENQVKPDVMGVNYYPRHSTELFETGIHHSGGFADPRPTRDDGVAGLAEMLRQYASRYGAPVMVAETCVTDDIPTRLEWLDSSVQAVRDLRDDGLDIVGYTWWPLFDMYEWTYRHSQLPREAHLLTMGLYDLVETEQGLARRRNPIADRFAEFARQEDREAAEMARPVSDVG